MTTNALGWDFGLRVSGEPCGLVDLLHDRDSADTLVAGYLSGGEDAADDMLNTMSGDEDQYNGLRVIHLNDEVTEEPVVLTTAKVCRL